MKSSTLHCLKFSKLKRRLSLPHWQCVGLLESLWLFTQANAPAGDIGRHSDEDIAAAIEWGGDATELIATLVACGWLDVCDRNRLVVHDWADHAPTFLKGAMAKNGRSFVTNGPSAKQGAKQGAKQAPKKGAKRPAKHSEDPPQQPAPNLTKPNLTKPNLTQPPSSPSDDDDEKQATEKPRNLLFDAIAEVCGMDPDTAGGLIASVAATLSKANPPYTPEDVRTFGRRFHDYCPWAKKDKPPRDRPNPKELEKWIGKMRAPPATVTPPPSTTIYDF